MFMRNGRFAKGLRLGIKKSYDLNHEEFSLFMTSSPLSFLFAWIMDGEWYTIDGQWIVDG